jgi:hypothetical protein
VGDVTDEFILYFSQLSLAVAGFGKVKEMKNSNTYKK